MWPHPQLAQNSFWELAVDKSVRNDPQKLICILIGLSYVEPFWYHLFIDYCNNRCFMYNYEGKWRLLHKLTRLRHGLLIMQYVTKKIGPRIFYGNWLPIISEFSKNPSVRFISQLKPKAKKIQRRRGYNDKGSRRLPHEVPIYIAKKEKEDKFKEDHRDSNTSGNPLFYYLLE